MCMPIYSWECLPVGLCIHGIHTSTGGRCPTGSCTSGAKNTSMDPADDAMPPDADAPLSKTHWMHQPHTLTMAKANHLPLSPSTSFFCSEKTQHSPLEYRYYEGQHITTHISLKSTISTLDKPHHQVTPNSLLSRTRSGTLSTNHAQS